MENDNLDPEFQGEQVLHEHFSFTADLGQEPLRVDKYLMNRVENATRNKIQNAAKEGSIFVNDVVVKSSYKVKGGDTVRVLFGHPPYENLLVGEDLPIDVVYEDDSLIIVNKAAGMVVHPGHGNYSGTLINGLMFHFDNLPQNDKQRPGLVHRIDKDTTGLLVVAKTESAMTHLSKQFFDKSSERKYFALVWGDVKADSGTIEGNIGTCTFFLRSDHWRTSVLVGAYTTTPKCAKRSATFKDVLGFVYRTCQWAVTLLLIIAFR